MWATSYTAEIRYRIVMGLRGMYTWTSLTDTVAFGVRGAYKSEAAMKAATTKQTVVKKPKTF